MVRIILSLLIGAHGIGHILFFEPLLGIADWEQSNRSWLLNNESVARFAGSLLWLVAIAGFCAAVYGLWNQIGWWLNSASFESATRSITVVVESGLGDWLSAKHNRTVWLLDRLNNHTGLTNEE